jgi:hypothetical protein
MTFPPKIGWMINPEAKSMPVNKRPFFIAFTAAPLLHHSSIYIILGGNSRVGQFIFARNGIRASPSCLFLVKSDRKSGNMESLEYFSDLFRKIGTPNLLIIGIVILILWLLISGVRKGMRKGGQEKGHSEKNGED